MFNKLGSYVQRCVFWGVVQSGWGKSYLGGILGLRETRGDVKVGNILM